MHTSVTTFLDRAAVPYEVKPHSAEAYTCEDAARERCVRLSQIVKTMVGADSYDAIHIMLIPGDRKLDLKRVRQIAGGVRIALVPPADIAERFGVTVGAISPTQFVGRARFYMDNSVFRETLVDISSGSPDAGVELRAEDLCRVLEALRCDIVADAR